MKKVISIFSVIGFALVLSTPALASSSGYGQSLKPKGCALVSNNVQAGKSDKGRKRVDLDKKAGKAK